MERCNPLVEKLRENSFIQVRTLRDLESEPKFLSASLKISTPENRSVKNRKIKYTLKVTEKERIITFIFGYPY